VVLVVVLTLGCSGSPPPRGLVYGTVSRDGEPLTSGQVIFENAEEGISITTPIGPDGRYEVRTYHGAGLPPGRYAIAVRPAPRYASDDEIPLAGMSTEPTEPSSPRIPVRYQTPETSGWSVDITVGGNKPCNLELKEF
jgi:hypothetical protein